MAGSPRGRYAVKLFFTPKIPPSPSGLRKGRFDRARRTKARTVLIVRFFGYRVREMGSLSAEPRCGPFPLWAWAPWNNKPTHGHRNPLTPGSTSPAMFPAPNPLFEAPFSQNQPAPLARRLPRNNAKRYRLPVLNKLERPRLSAGMLPASCGPARLPSVSRLAASRGPLVRRNGLPPRSVGCLWQKIP